MDPGFVTETLECIESLQIYTAEQAAKFLPLWAGEVDYIRFEVVSLPGVKEEAIATDLVLRSIDAEHSFIAIAILVRENGILFPSIFKPWGAAYLNHLAQIIRDALEKSPQTLAVRALHPNPRLPVREMVIERVLPGFRDYTTTVNHLKRYIFLLRHIRPGNILECACGTGYGAAILARLEAVTRYVGIDLSPLATATAAGNIIADPRFAFHAIDLALPQPETYRNVISLETIEHTPNPFLFLEQLIEKMAPDGQLLLSLPTETWGGSQCNPHHLSNWTRRRIQRFIGQYFLEADMYTQRLSLLGPTTFEASEISQSVPDEDADEGFVAILRQPKRNKNPTIVVKRLQALGDVIWITPILRALRRLHPEFNLLVVTNKTEVLINNPDVDLVFNSQYQPAPDDHIVDLDLAYEKRRELHILHAYALAAGVTLGDCTPRLYPSPGQQARCASTLFDHFAPQKIGHLLAVHMAALSADRIWPKTHWAALIQQLLDARSDLGIVVLGTGQDFKKTDLSLVDTPRILCLANQLHLMHTAAVMACVDLLIAPDSGLIHVAAAVDTPYLGLFGMANPAARLPLSGLSQAIWSPISCRGCLDQLPPEALPLCPLRHATCMEEIVPEKVFGKAEEMLRLLPRGQWTTRCRMALGSSDQPLIPAKNADSENALEEGINAFNAGHYPLAATLLTKATESEPDNPLTYAYLAFVAATQDMPLEADDFIRRALQLDFRRHELMAALGEIFLQNNRPDLAQHYLESAIEQQGDLFSAYPALAQAMARNGHADAAIRLLGDAAMMDFPQRQQLLAQQIELLATRGDLDGLARACLLAKNDAAYHSLGIKLLARIKASQEHLDQERQQYQSRFWPDRPPVSPASSRSEASLFRIGFVVSDFQRESGLGRLEALLTHLPADSFQTTVIDNDSLSYASAYAQRLSLMADQWLMIAGQEDENVLPILNRSAFDFLIDLDGHGPGERLALIARSHANFIISWSEVPPAQGAIFRTLFLDGWALGAQDWPSGEEIPRREAAEPRYDFACLTPVNQIAAHTWILLGKLLAHRPNSRLKLNLGILRQDVEQFILGIFARHGIEAERLRFIHAEGMLEYVRAWQDVDIGLAPNATWCDTAVLAGLWSNRIMLAPHETLAGPATPGALLRRMGKGDWLFQSAEELFQIVDRAKKTLPQPGLRETLLLAITAPEAFAHDFVDALADLCAEGSS